MFHPNFKAIFVHRGRHFMSKRKLSAQERERLAAARYALERLRHPGATVTVDEDTDDDGQPVYRVRYLDLPNRAPRRTD